MSEQHPGFSIEIAGEQHVEFAQQICDIIREAAHARGTGIAERTPEYITAKILEGKAIIALTENGRLAGFCYIETWSHGKYVANSGLVVVPEYRRFGLATHIKKRAFDLSREQYPDAKLFGITTSLAVMKINSELGYEPVTYSELTEDEAFWKGCRSCPNFDILTRNERKRCLCTAMLFDPEEEKRKEDKRKLRQGQHPKESLPVAPTPDDADGTTP